MSSAITQELRQQQENTVYLHDEHEIDLRGIFLIFWRRRILILSIIILGTLAAIIGVSNIQSTYTARALMLLADEQEKNVTRDLLYFFSGGSAGQGSVLSEVEVLKSRTLAAEIVKKLKLVNDKEFGTKIENNNGQELERLFKNLSVDGTEMKTLPPEAVDANVAQTVTNFLQALDVLPISGSSAVQVSFRSISPHKAALISNSVVDVYREYKHSLKNTERQKRLLWLDKRLETVRQQVFDAETKIEKYKTQNGLERGQYDVIPLQEINKLQQDAIAAQAKHLETKVQLEQLEKSNSLDSIAGSYAQSINANLIRSLQLDKSRMQTELSELSKRYGKKHPEIIKAKAQYASIASALNNELKNAKQTLKNELVVLEARIEKLNERVEEIRGTYDSDSEAVVKLREMEREAESMKMVLKTMLETRERVAGQESLDQTNIEVLSYASVPYEVSYPNKRLLVSLSALASLFIALALSILVEKVANIYRDAEQVEMDLGLPCYATMPLLKKLTAKELADYILVNPSSSVSEAVRSLKVALVNNKDTNGAQIITLTSCEKDQNKSALSIWLARMSAKSGEKVILIDANLRAPEIHKMLGINNDSTLVDYLSGQKQLEEVMKKDSSTGMSVLLGQSVPNTAFDLLNSKKMKLLLEALSKTYDTIIIDTPEAYELPDARVVGKGSDHVVCLATANKTSRDKLEDAMAAISEHTQARLGIVLNNIGNE